jgi:hypothetical protein
MKAVLVFAALVSVLSACKPLPPRVNELAVEHPAAWTELSVKSKKLALGFGTGMMSAFENLGVSGVTDADARKEVWEEVGGPMAHFANGTAHERDALKAAKTVQSALDYLGESMTNNGPWTNKRFNKMLRLKDGVAPAIPEIADGMKKLLFDYVQLVDPAIIEGMRIMGESD